MDIPDFDHGKRIYDLTDPNSQAEGIRARIPQFVDARKTEYLVLRSVLFSHDEACTVVKISRSLYSEWISTDGDFALLATGQLPMLQSKVGEQVLRAKFMRNMILVMHLDDEVLTKKMLHPEEMSLLDIADSIRAANRYNAASAAAMMRLTDGGQVQEELPPQINITIEVPEDVARDYKDKRIGAQMLLDKFTRNKNQVIEGEGRVIEG